MIPIIILNLKEPYDQQMMLELYEEYNEMMYSIALGYTKNDKDAEDAVQNTWLSLCSAQSLERLHTFPVEHPEKKRRYIARSVRNKSIDLLRKRRRKQSSETLLKTEEIDGAQQGDTSFVTNLALQEEIMACVAGIQMLPPKQKQYLTMYYLENQSYKEIARILAKTEDSVRSQVSDAKRSLKRRLQESREKQHGE